MEKKELPFTLKLRELVSGSEYVLTEGDRLRNAKFKEDNWGNPFKFKDYFAYAITPKTFETSPFTMFYNLQKCVLEFDLPISEFNFGSEDNFRREPGKIQMSSNGSNPKTYIHFPYIQLLVENPLEHSALEEVLNQRYSNSAIQTQNGMRNKKPKPTLVEVFFYPSEKYAVRALGNELNLDRVARYNNEIEIIKKFF